MLPFRFSFCTLNLWNSEFWKERKAALSKFLHNHCMDILCAQELTPQATKLILETLPDMKCVEDSFAGWQEEGNIFYNCKIFELLEYHALPAELSGNRRLFCARFKVCHSALHILIGTAHFTYQGLDPEKSTGQSPRLKQARLSIEHLLRMEQEASGIPILFGGDLNDFLNPVEYFKSAGFQEAWSSLGRSPEITWPAGPLASGTPEVDDWIFFKGRLRPLCVDLAHATYCGIPPSDHYPLLSMFEILPV